MMRPAPPRRFTGWHMTGLLVAFFAVVIAVNCLMATLAVRSFGGVVVDNSYVASQKFNGWLQQAKAQKTLGWRATLTRDAAGHIVITSDMPDVEVAAVASHPLGRAPDIALHFEAEAPGRLRSTRPLPAGRWSVHATVTRNGQAMRLMEIVQ